MWCVGGLSVLRTVTAALTWVMCPPSHLCSGWRTCSCGWRRWMKGSTRWRPPCRQWTSAWLSWRSSPAGWWMLWRRWRAWTEPSWPAHAPEDRQCASHPLCCDTAASTAPTVTVCTDTSWSTTTGHLCPETRRETTADPNWVQRDEEETLREETQQVGQEPRHTTTRKRLHVTLIIPINLIMVSTFK